MHSVVLHGAGRCQGLIVVVDVSAHLEPSWMARFTSGSLGAGRSAHGVRVPKPRGCSNVAMAPLNQSGCLRRQSFEGTATSVCCITPSSSPASGEKRIMNKGKRVFKRMFRRGVDKKVRMPLSLVRSNSHMFSQKKNRKEYTATEVVGEHENEEV